MCGRYAQSADMRQLMEQFQITGSSPNQALQASWNIAPTNPIYIIRADLQVPNERALAIVSWGLIGPWLRDLASAKASQSRAINARSESIHEKPTFRAAFKSNRCLIPAEGYYEWATSLGRYAPKQPFYIHSRNGRQLAIAGIWSSWQAPGSEFIESASIITQEAEGELAQIHNRMPLFMPTDFWDAWLNPENREVEKIKAMMNQISQSSTVFARPISRAVNSVSKNSAELTVEIDLGEPETLF